MCDKIKRNLMMEYNAEEVYQRRKRLWLTYGRALFTIGILGFLTVGLYAVSQNFWTSSPSNDTQISQMTENDIKYDNSNKNVNKERTKRSQNSEHENEIIPKDYSEILPIHGSSERSHSRRQQSSNNVLHRHSDDGGIYIFKGYKCVPISKPSKQLENLRARHRVGMCVCVYFTCSSLLFVLSIKYIVVRDKDSLFCEYI